MTSSPKYVNDCPTWFGVVAILSSDGLKQPLHFVGETQDNSPSRRGNQFPWSTECLP